MASLGAFGAFLLARLSVVLILQLLRANKVLLGATIDVLFLHRTKTRGLEFARSALRFLLGGFGGVALGFQSQVLHHAFIFRAFGALGLGFALDLFFVFSVYLVQKFQRGHALALLVRGVLFDGALDVFDALARFPLAAFLLHRARALALRDLLAQRICAEFHLEPTLAFAAFHARDRGDAFALHLLVQPSPLRLGGDSQRALLLHLRVSRRHNLAVQNHRIHLAHVREIVLELSRRARSSLPIRLLSHGAPRRRRVALPRVLRAPIRLRLPSRARRVRRAHALAPRALARRRLRPTVARVRVRVRVRVRARRFVSLLPAVVPPPARASRHRARLLARHARKPTARARRRAVGRRHRRAPVSRVDASTRRFVDSRRYF